MSTFFGDADRQAMLDDLGGVLVTVGATSAKCHVGIADEQLLTAEAVVFFGRVIEARAATGTFSGLIEGATVTVAASVYAGTYTLISAHQMPESTDGAFTRLLLGRTV